MSRGIFFKKAVIISLIFVCALALRLYKLDKYNFWYDEATVALSGKGLDKLHSFDKFFDREFMIKNIEYLKLYNYSVVYYWHKLAGHSDALLRLSSVIFSLLTICCLYLLICRIFGSQAAYLTILLFAVSPFSITYARELKPYSAIALTAVFAAGSFLNLLESNKKRHYVFYIISVVISAYFHCMTLLLLVSFLVFICINIKKYKPIRGRLLISHLIIIVLLIPVILTIYHHLQALFNNALESKFSDYPIWGGKITFRNLLFTLKNFSIGYNVDYYSFVGKSIMLVYSYFFIRGITGFYKKFELKLFLCCLFIPVLGLFAVSQIKPCYLDRYLFPVFPFFCLMIALGIKRIKSRFILAFWLIVILILNYFGLKNYYNYYLPPDHTQHSGIAGRQDIKSISGIISDNYNEGDIIMHTCRNTVFPLKFYIKQRNPKSGLIDEINKGTVIFTSEFYEKGLFTYDYDRPCSNSIFPKDYKKFENLAWDSRVWLILSDWYFKEESIDDYKEALGIVDVFRQHLREKECRKVSGARIYLFVPDSSSGSH